MMMRNSQNDEVYPRFLTPELPRFNPLELARKTEKIICRNNARKYTAFYATGVYGGIATGYTVGCCLRCFYCWVDLSREFPEREGNFFTAEEAYNSIERTAKKYGVRKARISGAEPTLCKNHLLKLLEYIESSDIIDLFILETNGIIFGADPDYVKALSKFSKPHIRLCIKAGTPESFETRTGAKGEFYELPYKGIRNLRNAGVSYHVAAMTDPRIMSADERKILIRKVSEIDPIVGSRIEEEIIDPYETTLLRLKYAGVKLDWEVYKRFFK